MKNKSQGFSLIELIVVISILGILAALALPAYNDSTQRGRRGDGQSTLLDLASRMESFYFKNKTYTTDISKLGFSSATTSEGFYTIGVQAATAACPITSCYSLQATAINGQVDDGNLIYNSLGQKLPADKW